MPNIIPPHVFLKRLVTQLAGTLVMGARAWLVVCVWVVLVPWITVWVWRIYFWIGNQFAWNVYGPLAPDEPPFGRPNSTDTLEQIALTLSSPITFVNRTYWEAIKNRWQHPEDENARARFVSIVRDQHERVGSDVIKGQIVTASLVVAFLAIFLLREWIIQNAVPGMFGDDGLEGVGPMEDPQVEVAELPENLNDPAFGAQQEDMLPAELNARIEQLRAEMARRNVEVANVPPPPRPAQLRNLEVGDVEQDRDEPNGTDSLPPLFPTNWNEAGSASPVTPRPPARRIPSEGPLFPPEEQPFAFGVPSSTRPTTLPPVLPSRETTQSDRQPIGPAQASDAEHSAKVFDMNGLTVNPLDLNAKEPPAMTFATFQFGGQPDNVGESFQVDPAGSPFTWNKVHADGQEAKKQAEGTADTRDVSPTDERPRKVRVCKTVDSPYNYKAKIRKSPQGESQNPFLDPNRPNPFATLASPSSDADVGQMGQDEKGKGKTKEDVDGLDELKEEFDRYFKEMPGDSPPQNVFEFDEKVYEKELAKAPWSRLVPLRDQGKEQEAKRSNDRAWPATGAVRGSSGYPPATTDSLFANGLADSPAAGFDIPAGTQFPSKFQFTFTPKGPDGATMPSLNFTSPPPPKFGPNERPRTPFENQAGPSRRPPLPPTTPNEELPSPFRQPWQGPSASGPSTGLPPKPLGTPTSSLATYRAPEQLDEEPGYFPAVQVEPLGEPRDISRHSTPIDQDESMDEGNTDVLMDSDSEWGLEIRQPLGLGDQAPGAQEQRAPIQVEFVQPDPMQDPPPVAEPAPVVRPDDEMEGMVEDEVEGAMEAIGMRGPLIQLVQNAILVQVLLYVTMAIGLCLPFTIGKTTLLLTLRPHRTLFVLKQPLVIIRLATDPFVDLLFWCLRPLLKLAPKYVPSQISEQTTSLRQFAFSILSRAGSTATKSQASPSAPASPISQVLAGYIAKYLGSAVQRLQANTTLVPTMNESVDSFLQSWTALVKGDGVRERGFAVAWGYLSTAIVLGTVLEWMGPNIGSTARAIRNIIRQQVILIKIRDILDRPAFTQMRKLGSSAMLYSGVLTIGIGSVLLTLRRKPFPPQSPLLPLRTSSLNPLSEIPVDLLFLHIVAPVTLNRLRVKRMLRYLLDKWWKMASRQLRLSSFMLGKRDPDEERYDTRSWFDRLRPSSRPVYEFRGCLARAPATDALALTSDQPVLIQVNENGEPQSERGDALMRSQNEACERAGLTVTEAFTITYLPPNFRLRILYFTCYLWFFGTGLLLSCFAVPVYIGRGWIHALGYPPTHDAYTWSFGLYTLIAGIIVWKELKRLNRRGLPTPQRFLRTVMVNGSQSIYLLVMIGIVLPILVALVVDFYVVLPIRLWFGNVEKLELHLTESWAVGLLYVKMGMRAARVDGENELYQAWQRILLGGWRYPDAIAATKDFIAPIGGPILIMMILPYLIISKVQSYYGLNDPLAPFRYGYPAIFYVAAMLVMSGHALKNLQKWTQGIRDAEFLVEMRLTNLEREDKDTPSSTAQPTTPTTPLDPEPPRVAGAQAPLAPLLPVGAEN
ncbi:hypothetical protein FRB90_009786 [Tulasnella sp. 427]|nr:hypothetical protein FRB90_009786 [Tulasnella sp. 427]